MGNVKKILFEEYFGSRVGGYIYENKVALLKPPKVSCVSYLISISI
jgi:hypothetical protein